MEPAEDARGSFFFGTVIAILIGFALVAATQVYVTHASFDAREVRTLVLKSCTLQSSSPVDCDQTACQAALARGVQDLAIPVQPSNDWYPPACVGAPVEVKSVGAAAYRERTTTLVDAAAIVVERMDAMAKTRRQLALAVFLFVVANALHLSGYMARQDYDLSVRRYDWTASIVRLMKGVGVLIALSGLAIFSTQLIAYGTLQVGLMLFLVGWLFHDSLQLIHSRTSLNVAWLLIDAAALYWVVTRLSSGSLQTLGVDGFLDVKHSEMRLLFGLFLATVVLTGLAFGLPRYRHRCYRRSLDFLARHSDEDEVDAQRLAKEVLKALQRVPEGGQVEWLDIGSGNGEKLAQILDGITAEPARVSLVVLDEHGPMLDIAKARLESSERFGVSIRYLHRRWEDLAEDRSQAHSFDVITCIHSLYTARLTVDAHPADLHFLSRLLRPGGLLLVVVEGPTSSFAKIKRELFPFSGIVPVSSQMILRALSASGLVVESSCDEAQCLRFPVEVKTLRQATSRWPSLFFVLDPMCDGVLADQPWRWVSIVRRFKDLLRRELRQDCSGVWCLSMPDRCYVARAK